MERANHINIAMMDDIDVNGTSRSKVMSDIDQDKQPCGSTVSFHNIQYKVQLKGGVFCKKKTSPKEILVDLKLVLTASSVLYLFFPVIAVVSTVCLYLGYYTEQVLHTDLKFGAVLFSTSPQQSSVEYVLNCE